jgi:hypothetical protein
MEIWNWKWFQKLIDICRKWKWFETYIYGESINLEDFVRNPAIVLRSTCFPFVIKDVKAISLINLRIGYKYFQSDKVDDYVEEGKKDNVVIYSNTYWDVPMGDKRKWILKRKKWTLLDIRIWNQFWTKFCNAFIFFQIVLSIKRFIPLPYIAFSIRFTKKTYFQFGLGHSPHLKKVNPIEYDAILTSKHRIASHDKEAAWNPGDVYGFWEGTI